MRRAGFLGWFCANCAFSLAKVGCSRGCGVARSVDIEGEGMGSFEKVGCSRGWGHLGCSRRWSSPLVICLAFLVGVLSGLLSASAAFAHGPPLGAIPGYNPEMLAWQQQALSGMRGAPSSSPEAWDWFFAEEQRAYREQLWDQSSRSFDDSDLPSMQAYDGPEFSSLADAINAQLQSSFNQHMNSMGPCGRVFFGIFTAGFGSLDQVADYYPGAVVMGGAARGALASRPGALMGGLVRRPGRVFRARIVAPPYRRRSPTFSEHLRALWHGRYPKDSKKGGQTPRLSSGGHINNSGDDYTIPGYIERILKTDEGKLALEDGKSPARKLLQDHFGIDGTVTTWKELCASANAMKSGNLEVLPNGVVRIKMPMGLCTPKCWSSMRDTAQKVRLNPDPALDGYSDGWKTLFPYGYDTDAAMEWILANPTAVANNYVEGVYGGVRGRIYGSSNWWNTFFPTFNQPATP